MTEIIDKHHSNAIWCIDILRLIGCTAATGVTGQSLSNKTQNALFDCGYIVHCILPHKTVFCSIFIMQLWIRFGWVAFEDQLYVAFTNSGSYQLTGERVMIKLLNEHWCLLSYCCSRHFIKVICCSASCCPKQTLFNHGKKIKIK